MKDRETHYRVMFENSPISIWEENFSAVKACFDDLRTAGVTDLEAYLLCHPELVAQCADLVRIIDVNQAALSLHGARSKEELFAGLTATFTPESFATFRDELICLWNGSTQMKRDAVVKTLAGEPRFVTVCFAVCPGYEETLGQVVVSLIDITDRKRAEAALSASEQQFRSLAENSPDNIVRYDRQCRANYINHALLSILPFTPEQILGKTPLELAAGGAQTDAEFEAHLRQVLESGESSDLELRMAHPTGGLRHHLVRFSAERDAAGEIVGVLAVGRDVTGLKLMDETLRFVAQQAWSSAAESFFEKLVRFLGEKLNLDYVLLDRLVEDCENAETIALYAKGSIEPNLCYALKGTPCENVMGRRLCAYPRAVQRLFPDDTLLAEMGVESYVGLPLWDSAGRPTGLLAVMDSKPIEDEAMVTQVLQLVATRAAAELERQQSDRMLRAREHEFRSLTENLPDNIIRYDRQGRAIYINSSLQKLLGISAGDRLGKRVREFHTDGSYEAYAQALDEVLESGVDREFEFVLPGPAENPPVHQVRMIAEHDESSEIVGALAISHDITAVKLAEQERQRSAELLASLDRVNRAIQAAGNLEEMMRDVLDEVLAIFACDRVFLMYPCDPSADSWTLSMERTRPECPGAGVLNEALPMDEEVAAMLALLRGSSGALTFGPGTDRALPTDIVERFGLKSFMSIALYPKVGNAWLFGLYQCAYERIWTAAEEQLLQEIARRLTDGLTTLLVQRDLRESEQKYRTLIQKIRAAVVVYGADTRILISNSMAQELLGLSEDQLLGRMAIDPDWHFVREDGGELPRAEYPVHQVLATRRALENFIIGVHRPGRADDIWVLVNAVPVFGETREITQVIVSFIDVTDRIRAEDELKRYRDHLEETVRQRTDELRLARDAAEAASRAKSVFLANMSHELRTPLNAILGFSELMRQDSALGAGQRENLEIINHSGKHLLKLINDVLEIAKIEAGRLQLQIAAFDLHELVREVVDMMRLRAQQKGLYLELDQSSEFPRYLRGDEARVRQILVNLVGNAVKFTMQGGVTIRLGVKHNTDQHLVIEVEDSGPGISERDRQRLFQPFAQLAAGATHGGTGLGLSIVRQFVELMGGSVSVVDAPGRGSLFRVELVLQVAEAADSARLADAKRGEVVGLAPGQPRYRILIAEDQADNQQLLVRLMSGLDFAVQTADDGAACVRTFAEWHPDLIWMDWRMPVMDGVEAARRIRQMEGGDRVRIIAVTASAFKEQLAQLRPAGMDDYVSKPYRINEIYQALARQLDVKYVYREAPVAACAPDLLPLRRLNGLAVMLREELRCAVESLDREQIRAVVGRIGDVDVELGRTLGRLADEFDYPGILQALDATNGGSP